MHQRKEIVNGLAVFLPVFTLLLSIFAGKSLIQGVGFSVLLGALVLICFRWWTHPVYNTPYDYFSPLAIFQILSFIYMGIGNIFAFNYHDSMRGGSNPGADDYYTLILCISVLGLFLFELGYRYTVKQMRESDGKYPLANAQLAGSSGWRIKINSLIWYLIVYGVFAYMSSKYIKSGYVYLGVENEIDNILNHAGPGLFFMAWANISFLLFMTRNKLVRFVHIGILISLLPVLFSYGSRTMAMTAVMVSCICYIVANPGKSLSFSVIVVTLFLVPVAYVALTGVKMASIYDRELHSVLTNEYQLESRFDAIVMSPVFMSTVLLETDDAIEYAKDDSSMRVAGLEYPAAMLKANYEDGKPYMLGYHNLVAVGIAIPRVIWPGKPADDPKYLTDDNFNLWAVEDQLPTVIGSAFADGGFVGVIIGLPLLGAVMCLIQHWIWSLKDNLLLYFGGLGYLTHYESYLATMPMNWMRLLLIVFTVNLCISFFYRKHISHPKDRCDSA